jgi:hypothetical protein
MSDGVDEAELGWRQIIACREERKRRREHGDGRESVSGKHGKGKWRGRAAG